ncbi:MAG: succinate semialdehyde dehydrogenase NADP+ linked [Peltula sp. TS41687]|nr:MAG: succinate semialdehyde dehydrogenase NADP+ linked [Peltula sp. TS41687]
MYKRSATLFYNSYRLRLILESNLNFAIASLSGRRRYAMLHQVPPLNDQSLFREECYVNGQWIKAKSGKTFEVNDPASMKKIGTCPEFDKKDTEGAIAAAATAFVSFRTTTGRERGRMLRKWYDLIMENAEDLAKLIVWENGKPLADAKAEVAYSAAFFEWFSEEAPRTYGDTIPATIAGNRVLTLKQPVGVCGLITPWNFPAAMITRKIGPALAAGCTVVAKSPGETPFTSLALAELAHRAGIPKGVVNFVTALGNTAEVGETLTSSDTVKKISFTGSTPVGKLLMKQSASTLKKLSFELGGNAPFIVFDDADLDQAITGAISSKFRSSGQTCVCANRIYVQRGIYDAFAQGLASKVRQSFHVGPGFKQGITHGPLIHERAVSKVQQHVHDAQSKGATVLLGGSKMPELGPNFFQPTVIKDMNGDMQLASEETFGPIAGLFPFDTEAEVVRLANRSEVGLAGYFYSRDVQRIWRVAEALEVGMVGVNTGLISDVAAPFGGIKQSGFGREGSKYGIEEYQVIKTITMGGVGGALQGE